MSYLVSSYIAEKLKFTGFENYKTTKNILSKINFNVICKQNNIPVPKFSLKKNFYNDNINLPLIYRPEFTESGKNIFKINNKSDLFKLKKNKRKKFIISEFIEGTLHSCTMMIHNIRNEFVFVDEFCNEQPYTVDLSNSPSILPKNIKQKVISNLNKISKIFKLKSGILHVQFIKNKNRIFFIEATRRCPGDYFGLLIQKIYNFDYYLYYCKNFLSKQTNIKIKENKNFMIRKTLKESKDYDKYANFKSKKLYLSYAQKNKKKYGVLFIK